MVRILSILSLLAIISVSRAENPGIVAVIKKPIIEEARDQYFTQIFKDFGEQTIPDIKKGDIKTSDGRVSISNGSPKNLDITFNPKSNSIGVQIKDTKFSAKVKYKYHKVVTVKGDVEVSGKVENLKMNIVLDKTSGKPIIPQIKVEDFEFGMSKKSLKFRLHCKHCPSPVEKLISNWMKGDLVDEIRKQVKKKVPQEIATKGNKVLKEEFPEAVNLYNNIDISTLLTSNIKVDEDHLEIPIDGTLFLHDKGYKRPESTKKMPHYNPEDPGEIQVFLNSYLLKTMSTVINSEKHSYESRILGIKYQILLDPELGGTELSFIEGDFIIDTHPRIYSETLKLGMEFEAICKMDPEIKNGGSKNMMSIIPNVDSLSLKSFRLIVFGKTINLDPSTNLLNPILRFVLNWMVVPTINISKKEILPLKVTNSEVDFHDVYSEVGIAFKLG